MSVVVLNLPIFRARYPEFAELGDLIITMCFAEAGLYCCNTDCSIIHDVNVRLMLLNMLTAHILVINFGANGQAASPLVGRIASAHEGSVSVTTDFASNSKNAAWYNQTKYGAAYWQATSSWRSALYIPPPCQPMVIVPRM